MSSSKRTVATSHADIAVGEVAGDGLPVVMIHGNSSNRGVFSHQMDSAAAAGRRAIALDLPGHGESSDARDPERTYTMPGYADAVIETLGEMEDPGRESLRALQPYLVNVPPWHLERLRDAGAVEFVHETVFALGPGFEELYDDNLGLTLEGEMFAAPESLYMGG